MILIFCCLEKSFGTNFCMFNVIPKIFLEEWFYEKLSWESSWHHSVCTRELPRRGNFSDCLKGLYSKDMFSKDFERGFRLKIHPSDNFSLSHCFCIFFSFSTHYIWQFQNQKNDFCFRLFQVYAKKWLWFCSLFMLHFSLFQPNYLQWTSYFLDELRKLWY